MRHLLIFISIPYPTVTYSWIHSMSKTSFNKNLSSSWGLNKCASAKCIDLVKRSLQSKNYLTRFLVVQHLEVTENGEKGCFWLTNSTHIISYEFLTLLFKMRTEHSINWNMKQSYWTEQFQSFFLQISINIWNHFCQQ